MTTPNTDQRNDAVRECPFCGAAMAHCTDKDGEFWMHPGFVTDDDCFMSGQGVFPRQLTAWNARALSPSPASSPLEGGGGVREGGDVADVREFADKVMDAAHDCCIDPDGGPDVLTSVSFTGEEGSNVAQAMHRLAARAALSTDAGSGEVRAWEYESPDGKERLVRCRRATAGEFPYWTERALTYAVAVAEAGKPAPTALAATMRGKPGWQAIEQVDRDALEAIRASDQTDGALLTILVAHRMAPQPAPSEERLREGVNLALACTPQVRDGQIIYDCGDPWKILRAALSGSAVEDKRGEL